MYAYMCVCIHVYMLSSFNLAPIYDSHPHSMTYTHTHVATWIKYP